MGRRVDVDDLVGTTEIAARLGFRSITAVHYCYRSDPGFPAPVFELGSGAGGGAKIWCWPDVEAWAVETGRLAAGRKGQR